MKLSDKVRNAIRNFLEINDPQGLSVNIEQKLDFDAEVFKNSIWYRGRANELQQFYASTDDGVGNQHFWGAAPSSGMKIRKIHTGLPGLIVDTLTDVCTDDLNGITVEARQDEWNGIAEENEFEELIAESVRNVLALGDGAFKLSYDSAISEKPIIEFYPADRVEFERSRGRLVAVIFKTLKKSGNKSYLLKERYARGSITYSLETPEGKEADLSLLPDGESYRSVSFDEKLLPAVPLMFRKSTIHKGRGKSIFDLKHDNFDAFDEVVSQWMLAVRKGQIKTYIPSDLIPRKEEDGELITPNDFDNDYIELEGDMREDGGNKIKTTQGEIQHEARLSTYCTTLDLCLQGIVSPSTLGIDVKKLDNADAQREKEKTTLYTRNKVVSVLEKVIPRVVEAALRFSDNLENKEYEKTEITVNFGGYANPSFEAQVETVGKASTLGIMSTETAVEEIYGDSKDEAWKAEEVKRLKWEKGIEEMDEPAVNDDASSVKPIGFVVNE